MPKKPNTTEPPFVLIVEDHPLVAESLAVCVRGCSENIDIKHAESLRMALSILADYPTPLLILTDLTLTDVAGTEVVRAIRHVTPHVPLIVVTALDDPQLRSDAKAEGAVDYVLKSAAIASLRTTICAFISDELAPKTNVNDPTDAVTMLLTPRQRKVIDELVAGRSNREIAVRMKISNDTVNSHVKEILGRLGARNRTEAVVRYLQLGKITRG